MVGLVLFAAACASVEQPTVGAADAGAWSRYRAGVLPAMTEVLGETADLAERCRIALDGFTGPRFEVDPRPTLRTCAEGDYGTARQLAHQVIDDIATNDEALAETG